MSVRRTRCLIALLLVAALPLAGCSAVPPAGATSTVSTAGPAGATTTASAASTSALAPFYRRLAALETGRDAGPLVILHFGDSHTAADKFSGRLRERFQQRFGAAGRGSLPPGEPFDYFRPTLVSVSQQGDWTVANSWRRDAEGLFGISGFRTTSRDDDASMTLTSDETGGFDRAEIVVLTQPGGGTLVVEVDGRPVHELATEGPVTRAARLDLPVAAGSRSLSLRPAGDGPVSLLSWGIERTGRGVVYDSHGIVGSTVNVIAEWEPSTVAWEIANRDPALIVLAYGTNEGFNDGLDAADYAADFAARLTFLRQAAPDAALLVVGPPDANRLPRGCDGGGHTCAPLSAGEIADYGALFGAAAGGERCRWHPPPNLDVVRQIQAEVAARQGAYFWDWSQVMGGACGAHRWATGNPSLAYDDHVHFRTEGYRQGADALFDALMRDYDSFLGG